MRYLARADEKMIVSSTTNLAAISRENDFANYVASLSSRIEWVRAETTEERQAIFRLRYRAYLREGMIPANPFEKFTDGADSAENGYLFGVYIDGKLASSLRLHIASKNYPDVPSLEVFPHVLQPLLDAGRVIVDCTHLVADEGLSRQYPVLPYITIRPCVLAAEYFRGDELLAAVRLEHQAFYRRAFNYRVLCEPRQHPPLTKHLSLVTLYFPVAANQLYEKYPFLCSSPFERDRLFANESLRHPKTVVGPRGETPA
jgi:hypothetical protein